MERGTEKQLTMARTPGGKVQRRLPRGAHILVQVEKGREIALIKGKGKANGAARMTAVIAKAKENAGKTNGDATRASKTIMNTGGDYRS
mmetsp:Transcript_11117/g.27181  ORF Transcript_11117/g.27181 Transcript_11117/m.27181 type:complete len:89 (-) Transcript_11117:56-322(-)